VTTKEILPHPFSVHNYVLEISGSTGQYMESGLLDHLNTAPLNENTYLPSQLYYGSDIEAIRSDNAALGSLKIKSVGDLILDGENRDEGDSLAVGCSEKSKTSQLTATTDFGSETFNSSTPIYCPLLKEKKDIQTLLPASKFSGKLRLMVQAIYGSKRDDYSMGLLEDLGPLSLTKVDLKWTYNDNRALFTGDNWRYYLLSVMSSGLWARELVPSKAGQKLREYLRNNSGIPDARKRRYETYLLSTLDGSDDLPWVQLTEDSGDAYDKGTPWYYGWSWNMAGTEARAVTVQLKPGTDNEWQSTMFKLTVSENTSIRELENGRIAASFVTIEETQDFTGRTNGDLVWWPHDLSSGMQPWIPAPLYASPPVYDFDVPMYTVYDYANDKFDVVRYRREDRGTDLGGGISNANQTVNPYCGSYACDYGTNAGSTISDAGFYIDDYDQWDAVGMFTNGLEMWGNEAAIQRPGTTVISETVGNFNSALTLVSWGNESRTHCEDEYYGTSAMGRDDTVHRLQDLGGPSFGGQLYVNGDFEFESLFIVPYADCDSVYLGRWRSFSGNVINTGHTKDGLIVSNTGKTWNKDDDPINLEITLQVDYGDSSSHYGIVGVAKNKGLWTKVAGKTVTWDEMSVRFFINGADNEVHESKAISDAEVAEKLFVPTCVRNVVFGENTPQITPGDALPQFEHGSVDMGGFEFDPVLFNLPPYGFEVGPRVESYSTANHEDYRATKKPTTEWIEAGGYGFDENNISNLFSWVGFA